MHSTNPNFSYRRSFANKATTLDCEQAAIPVALPNPPSRYEKSEPRFANRKVLIIVENQPAPSDPRVWKEALSLYENGYDVTILCPRGEDCAKGYEMCEGIRIYRHPMPGEWNSARGYLWEYSCALIWEFVYTCWIYLRHGFHVIEGCNPPDDIFMIALPFKLLGVKYIFDHHDAAPELFFSKFNKNRFFYKVLLCLEKQSYRFSDVVMATNNSYRDLALTRGHRALDNVFVVRSGADLENFRGVPPNPERKHGKRHLIGYVGIMGTQDGWRFCWTLPGILRTQAGAISISRAFAEGPNKRNYGKWRKA